MSPGYVCEVSAQNAPQIICYIFLKMPILSGGRNTLFSCKWAAVTRPLFQYRAVALQLIVYLRYSAQKNMLGFHYYVYRTEIMHFKQYYWNFWYTVSWAHTSEARAQKVSVIWYASTKWCSLSCLIVFKLSHTYNFMLKHTHESQKQVMSVKVNSWESWEIACLY